MTRSQLIGKLGGYVGAAKRASGNAHQAGARGDATLAATCRAREADWLVKAAAVRAQLELLNTGG